MYKNHVDLIGFIGSDAESRQLENGAQLTLFSLATKTRWKNAPARTTAGLMGIG
jgi:single-stranded DNA-binding protein